MDARRHDDALARGERVGLGGERRDREQLHRVPGERLAERAAAEALARLRVVQQEFLRLSARSPGVRDLAEQHALDGDMLR